MVSSWGVWRPFPNPQYGGHLEAPVGPGVYEVRHADTGALVAFGPSPNVAQSLAGMLPKHTTGLLAAFRRRARYAPEELEYRTFTATDLAEARSAAERLLGRR
jgi:hypothetical protein